MLKSAGGRSVRFTSVSLRRASETPHGTRGPTPGVLRSQGPVLLTNGRSRSSEHLDGLNGRDTHSQRCSWSKDEAGDAPAAGQPEPPATGQRITTRRFCSLDESFGERRTHGLIILEERCRLDSPAYGRILRRRSVMSGFAYGSGRGSTRSESVCSAACRFLLYYSGVGEGRPPNAAYGESQAECRRSLQDHFSTLFGGPPSRRRSGRRRPLSRGPLPVSPSRRAGVRRRGTRAAARRSADPFMYVRVDMIPSTHAHRMWP
jgi:hypothetical protein